RTTRTHWRSDQRMPSRSFKARRSPTASVARRARRHRSKNNVEAVVGGGDFETRVAPRDLLEAPCVAEHAGDLLVVGERIVMEQAEMLHVRHLAELDADDVAGMPPVLFHRDRV